MERDITRREAMCLSAGAAASWACGALMEARQSLTPAVEAVDHLLLGVSDLDRGIAWVEEMTGVRAVVGGSHPGVGTRNALLSFSSLAGPHPRSQRAPRPASGGLPSGAPRATGGRQYLEIIAPDPEQTAFNSRHDVRKLSEPRLVAWAAAASDIDAVAKKAAADGRKIFGPRDGSRVRPDGKTLRWQTLAIVHEFGVQVDPVPFFIEWAADSVHPSQDSPAGCRLERFEIESPEASELAAMLESLGISANVRSGPAVRLRAVLETPKGAVLLT